jgi:antitoxin PrlF
MPTATLTSKGQVTLPKEVREKLHLQAGSRVDFVIEGSGRVILKPLLGDFRLLKGIVRSKRKRPITVDEMNEAIARGYSNT